MENGISGGKGYFYRKKSVKSDRFSACGFITIQVRIEDGSGEYARQMRGAACCTGL
ncbi:hypothetical protein [Schaedlerella arabinosiphila]|jgi:hypothetical protein|uniref:hypothetical protein n=1 Tax=Schaedlerella arabinosiphila TaxID=2044587 RepID=UPI0012B69A04|nr:hypothetical protein [Schaedlerella arabinosiphila]